MNYTYKLKTEQTDGQHLIIRVNDYAVEVDSIEIDDEYFEHLESVVDLITGYEVKHLKDLVSDYLCKSWYFILTG